MNIHSWQPLAGIVACKVEDEDRLKPIEKTKKNSWPLVEDTFCERRR